MSSQADRLRDLTDAELRALLVELEERDDQFDAHTRMHVNDELRRRKITVERRR